MSARIVHVNRIRTVISIIWLILFTVSYFIMAYNNTMLPGSSYFLFYLSIIRDVLVLMSIVGVVLDYLSERVGYSKKGLFVLALKLAILFTCYYIAYLPSSNQDNVTIWLMIVFAITADTWEEDVLLKIAFTIGSLIVVVVFFLSITGIIENNRGNSFGFTYRTHYAFYLMCLVLVWCIIKNGWLTWIGELGLLLMTAYELFIVGGKTAFISMTILDVVLMWRHYKREGKVPYQNSGVIIKWLFKLLYLPVCVLNWITDRIRVDRLRNYIPQFMKWSFLIAVTLNFATILCFVLLRPLLEKIPNFSTASDRLLYALMGFQEYPITLFGTSVSTAGVSGSETFRSLYFVLDSSYVNMLIRYGLVLFILVLCFMTWTQIRLFKNKRFFTMFAISIFAFYCVMEAEMTNLSYNFLIILAFCKLSEKPGIEACDGLSLSTRKSRAIGIGVVSIIPVFVLWSVTAYHITNWRGWTPDYNATVLVFPNSEERLLECTRSYLNSHKDALCIVCSSDEKAWLIEKGINRNRISFRANTDVDEILLSAYDYIKANKLYSRLTVCAFNIQQLRISKRAASLHIPVNSLNVKPRSGYLRMLAEEQWRLLWGD